MTVASALFFFFGEKLQVHCLLSWCYCIGMPLLTYQAGQVHCCLFDIMDSLNLFDNFFFLSKIQVVKIFGMLCIKKNIPIMKFF